MPSSAPTLYRQHCSLGRGFTPLDPERQREVAGYVRSGPIATVPQAQDLSSGATCADWMGAQPDRDFEGSSSRHDR
jgi:hypothetical protein